MDEEGENSFMKKFFPKEYTTVIASDPHPDGTAYKVSLGDEVWGGGISHSVVKVQMMYDGKVAGRKSPSYPLGTDDYYRVNVAVRDLVREYNEKTLAANNLLKLNNGWIFEHAFDILYASIRVGVVRLAQGDKTGATDAALLVPLAVNGAFACEQYIKSMLKYENKEHNLVKLFRKLNDEEQEIIKNKAVEEICKQPGIHSYDEERFENDLKRMGSSFEEWRYFYEGKTKNTSPQFFKGFMIALRVVAKQKVMEKDFES